MTLDEFQAELSARAPGLAGYFAEHYAPLVRDAEWEPPEKRDRERLEREREESQRPMRDLQAIGMGNVPGTPQGRSAAAIGPETNANTPTTGPGQAQKQGAPAWTPPTPAQAQPAGEQPEQQSMSQTEGASPDARPLPGNQQGAAGTQRTEEGPTTTGDGEGQR
jgi:hypothetical protein